MASAKAYKAELFKDLTAVHDSLKAQSISPLQAKLIERKTEKIENEYVGVKKEILAHNASLSPEELKTQSISTRDFATFDVMFDKIYELCLNIQEKANTTPAVSTTSKPQLPRLKLPSFSGCISEWNTFFELFSSLCHSNQSLSDIEKFQYLKGCLKGEALALMSNYEFTAANYASAFSALEDRFANKRRLAAYYVQKIMRYSHSSKSNITELLECHRASEAALKNLKLPDLSDFIMFEITYSNCPEAIKKTFDQTFKGTTPTFKDIIQHIEVHAKTKELQLDCSPSAKPPVKYQACLTQSKKQTCGFCSDAHPTYFCSDFKKLSPHDRVAAVKDKRLCFNCLGNHALRLCASKSTCRVCSKKHHSLIHLPSNEERQAAKSEEITPSASLSCTVESQVEVLLCTVRCFAKDDFGKLHSVRALLDNGSQRSMVTTKLVERLGLKVKPENRLISGISQTSETSKGTVNLQLISRNSMNTYECSATVMNRICAKVPSVPLPAKLVAKFEHLELADPHFTKPAEIDILLDAQAYASLLVSDQPNVISGFPSAVKTSFGWAVFGATKKTEPEHSSQALVTQSFDLEAALNRFWEVEEVSTPHSTMSLEEEFVENQFVSTHTRDVEGRFIVKLPFIPGCNPLELNNRDASYSSYLRLENRLSRKPLEQKLYREFMNQFLTLGHMSAVDDTIVRYVMPHHCVFKDSTSTKLRCVFNGSAPDSRGRSLNSMLYPGPKLQTDLGNILLRIRFGAVALCADIKMMFRQIKVHPDDANHQLVFWRPDSDSQVQRFQINRLVYGMTPSSYLAQRCLRQLADEVRDNQPHIADILENNVFMDDFAFAVSSVSEAIKVRNELTSLLDSACFPLRKWASSHEAALDGLAQDHKETLVEFSAEPKIKILGLCWYPQDDTLGYSVQKFEGAATKRKVLSYISCIFDPLGLLSPVVSYAKQFLQSLFLLKVDWDAVLPEEYISKWRAYLTNFECLRNIRIQRYLISGAETHIVGFSDSSEAAFACCVYLQTYKDGEWSSQIIKGKSRVAPLKRQSIPRLELLGALLLARTVQSVVLATPNQHYVSTTLFTDSAIVLAWLKTPSYRLKTFVGNRVAAIQELTSNARWAHCRSEWNASDCASRGITPELLVNHPLWWSGPDFLRQGPAYLAEASYEEPSELPEVKEVSTTLAVSSEEEFLLKRFSTFTNMVRVIAWMRRFANNAARRPRLKGPLTVPELRLAREQCIKLAQLQDFAQDIAALKAGKPVSARLQKLTPFLSDRGLLRVGGRLRNSNLSASAKHPILLSKTSHLSALICDDYHRKLLHSGPRTTKAFITRQYWIISLHSLVRQVIHRCRPCFRLSAKPVQPLMGELPADRVTVSHSFERVGTDFAGPFYTKESTMRRSVTHKSYFCIFRCMSSTASHIEPVSDLTTQAFIACFHRFVARRGYPAIIYSDSGRNYIGASRVLKECSQFLKDKHEEILTHLSTLDVQWSNAPPTAANFGGLYEAGVKSCKLLLHRLIGDQVLTFEEFATVLARVEAVLNSRVLEFASAQPGEEDYLSVGHLLIGRPLCAPPEIPMNSNPTTLQRWDRVKRISQQFWQRWSTDYLHTLMQRNKWFKATANIKCGQLVYLSGEATSPLSWPIGRVIDVHPGRDGVVRVVTVKTGSGTYIRPVNKLVSIN